MYNLSRIMKRAHKIRRDINCTMSEGLKRSWALEKRFSAHQTPQNAVYSILDASGNMVDTIGACTVSQACIRFIDKNGGMSKWARYIQSENHGTIRSVISRMCDNPEYTVVRCA